MASEEKKGGMFSGLRKRASSGNEVTGTGAHVTPAVQQQSRNVTTSESKRPSVSAEKPEQAPVLKHPAHSEQSEPVQDQDGTVAAFNFYCRNLADLGASQLKTVEMALNMLSNSIKKIAEGLKVE